MKKNKQPQLIGTPRVIYRAYRYDNELMTLAFDRTTGEVQINGRWVDGNVAKILGYIQQSPTVPLPTPKPLPFGNPAKYQGRWTTTRTRGSAEGTGAYI